MGRAVLKFTHEGIDYYSEWSSVVDAPITYLLTREDFEQYYREEYGRFGMQDFQKMMERVDETGTSSRHFTREEIISANRAGPNETKITEQEIIRHYLLEAGREPEV